MQNPPIRGNKQNQQQNHARSIVHVYANHKHGAAASTSRSSPRLQGGFIPLRRGAWHPRSPSSSSRGGDDLHRRMFAWQGGGQRRRFVPRKEPIKTSGTSFSPTDFRRTNAWRQARDLEQKDWPLKQPAISLRPGSYGEREDSRSGVSRIGRPDLWSLFTRVSFFVFPSTFFFVFPSTPRTCARTPIPGYRSLPMMADSATASHPRRAHISTCFISATNSPQRSVYHDWRVHGSFTYCNYFCPPVSRSLI